MTDFYSSNGVQLPCELEKRFFKWISEGEEKQRYEIKWGVYSKLVNEFVEQLHNEYEGLALSNVSNEARGPLTIVTATYGDEKYTDDQSVVWWSLNNGVYSMHVRKAVRNTQAAIKAFCANCLSDYGYRANEVSVSCNPQAGDEYVICEATFTAQNQVTDEEDDFTPPSENPEDPEENQVSESSSSMQMASTITTIPIPASTYLNKKIGKGNGSMLLDFVASVESGEYRWIDKGEWGIDKPSKSGWFKTTGIINPNNMAPSTVKTYPKEDVNNAITALKSIPSVTVPQIRVTITTKVTSKNRLTLQALGKETSSVGDKSSAISEAGISVSIPEGLKKAKDTEGNEYDLETEWLDEGVSFDISNLEVKTSLNGGKFYQGTKTHSWSTVSTVKPIKDTAEPGGTNG